MNAALGTALPNGSVGHVLIHAPLAGLRKRPWSGALFVRIAGLDYGKPKSRNRVKGAQECQTT